MTVFYGVILLYVHVTASTTGNLLIDPIALPDMSHVDIPATRYVIILSLFITGIKALSGTLTFIPLSSIYCSQENNNTPRLFYATGEKNPNIQKQLEKRLQPEPLEEREVCIQKKLMKTTKKKTK